MNVSIKLQNRKIGPAEPVFMVAELSTNHSQRFDNAVRLIKAAKSAGADAIKLQAYTPDSMTLNLHNRYFNIRHTKWKGQTLYELYRKSYTPWSWFKRLKKITDDLGMIFFSTAFDRKSVDFLEELRVPVHKIASFELVDLPLIEYIARTKKPIILSTGMATIKEIKEAVSIARSGGAKNLILLKCVSAYPAKPRDMNLETIPHMKRLFSCPIGLSDHTLEIGTSIAAVCLGAEMVEKHFTLSRKTKTPDNFFSTEPEEFRELVYNIRIVENARGKISYEPTTEERKNRIFRRSLFAVSDIKKGEILTAENVNSIRPAYGLAPKYLKLILGKKAKKAIAKGTPLKLHLIKY